MGTDNVVELLLRFSDVCDNFEGLVDEELVEFSAESLLTLIRIHLMFAVVFTLNLNPVGPDSIKIRPSHNR